MRLELKNLNTCIRQIAYSVNEAGYNKVKSKGYSTLSLFRTGVLYVTRVLSGACNVYLFPYTVIKLSQMRVELAGCSQLTKPSLEETFLLLLYYLLRRCRYLADIYFYDLRYHSYNLGFEMTK